MEYENKTNLNGQMGTNKSRDRLLENALYLWDSTKPTGIQSVAAVDCRLGLSICRTGSGSHVPRNLWNAQPTVKLGSPVAMIVYSASFWYCRGGQRHQGTISRSKYDIRDKHHDIHFSALRIGFKNRLYESFLMPIEGQLTVRALS